MKTLLLETAMKDHKQIVDEKHGGIHSLHESVGLAREEMKELLKENVKFKSFYKNVENGIFGDKMGVNNFYGTALKRAIVHAENMVEEAADLVTVLRRTLDLVEKNRN